MGLADGKYRRNVHARSLFDGIAPGYEGPAQLFSLGQYRRWRRSLVSRLKQGPQALVLDVCTGTGLVAMEIARQRGCRVVGVDLSDRMVVQARDNLRANNPALPVVLVKGRAEGLPFAERTFDAVVFTFLLRYVEDPQITLHELSRVLRPGGQMASLEFFVPPNPVWRSLWLLHTRLVLPLGTRFFPKGWREVGLFLGPSISAFYRKYPLRDLSSMWEQAGINNIRVKVLPPGGAVVMWGQKEAYGN